MVREAATRSLQRRLGAVSPPTWSPIHDEPIQIEIAPVPPGEAPRACEPILRSVPEWFGIEESTRAYIAATARLPTWTARVGTEHAGFVTIERHFPESAEIHCIAVHRNWHGRGIGTALVRHIEDHLRSDGVRMLQVKTLGPSKPNAQYALTHRFYESVGFARIEELKGFWNGLPCLVLAKAL